MRAIIAGGTGFIGKALVAELRANNWEIIVLSRSASKVAEVFGEGVIGMPWDNGDWSEMLGPETAIVNLAGENISGRWNAAKKKRILSSRVQTGQRFVEIVERTGALPSVFIQASAVGYYGPQQTDPIDEQAPSGRGFLADVARQWEASTLSLEQKGVRRCVIRTGMVLGHGGALDKMLPPFRAYVGGPLGTGTQGVSWIHLSDEVRAIRFLMETQSATGAYNLVAPTPVRFKKFARILGQVLQRPYKLQTPAFVLRLLLGEMAEELLLSGQLVLPTRLSEAGFEFQFPDLEGALRDLLA